MNITFKGTPITLKGKEVKVGDTSPDFTLINNELNPVTLKDIKGKRIFVVLNTSLLIAFKIHTK